MISQKYKPSPEKYEGLSPSEARAETDESFATIRVLYDEVSEKGEMYKERMNQLIREKASAERLAQVIQEEDYQRLCQADGDLNACSVIVQVALMEESIGLPSILTDINSMDEAITLFQQIAFGLRRIAFSWEKEELFDFLNLIRVRGISYICLAVNICQKNIVNQIATACKLARLLSEQDMAIEGFKLLVLLDNMFAYSDEKIIEFAHVFLDLGAIKMAYEELRKYHNPSTEILLLTEQLYSNIDATCEAITWGEMR